MASERSDATALVEQALARVAADYADGIAAHGPDARAVGWGDRKSQNLRFEKLAYVLDAAPPRGPVSVNDWGCGYGALFGFLDGLPDVELASYRGYDISPEMIAAAKETVDDPRAEFVEGSAVDREADYCFVSGTFNARAGAGEEVWAEFVRQTILEISERSRHGFAFNLLTTYVDWRDDDLFYADPLQFFRFCRKHVSRSVTLLHDYPLYEWTIAVLLDPPEGTR